MDQPPSRSERLREWIFDHVAVFLVAGIVGLVTGVPALQILGAAMLIALVGTLILHKEKGEHPQR
jgi:hypothetical protein